MPNISIHGVLYNGNEYDPYEWAEAPTCPQRDKRRLALRRFPWPQTKTELVLRRANNHAETKLDRLNRLDSLIGSVGLDLFLQVSELEPSPQVILDFVNQVGLLGIEPEEMRLHFYQEQFVWMNYAVHCWEALCSDSPGRCQSALFLDPSHARPEEPCSADPRVELAFSLGGLVSRQLSEATLPKLGIAYFYTVNGGKGFEFELTAPSMRAQLWLQFANALVEKVALYRCPTCNRPQVLVPGENRTTRKYCSTYCRIVAFRKAQRAESQATTEEPAPPKTESKSVRKTAKPTKKRSTKHAKK